MRMRMTMLGAAVLCGVMAAHGAAEVVVPGAGNADVQTTLDLLEARGATLKDFTANLMYSVEHVRDGTTETNGGTVALVNDGADKKLAIVLDTLIVDNKIARKGLNHQIVFDGQWIYDKDPQAKIYRRVEVAKPGAKVDVFSLHGPIPLPIGQKAAGVLADFDVEKVDADKDDPATAVALKLTPKDKKAYDFSDLTIVVDTAKDVQLPIRLIRTGKDKNITTISFVHPKINTGEAAKAAAVIVDEPKKEEGWTVDIKPLEEK